ncbi:DUF1298 domain-containing protein [Microbacterium sp. Sa4CUA7]|uniref:diacylglycerol O-acyltransferase n=1 Tax=Microbacterium pullorum TaxID=2762236 RepID=A0ABR8RZP2_9MICO|nr:wax ester/triacylglycerol synthase domain-containing protein [Microbacterium pullorum]MBD7956678.1 DUF1298 domain-containing protein [Microbacterium pullorum]
MLDHPGQVNVFLAAGLLSAGGFLGDDGKLDITRLRATLGQRIAQIPALRRRVVSRRGRRHVWVAATPDLREHVRSAPPLSDRRDLETWCGHLMAVPLPRQRPLWELLVAPFEAGRAAFVLRVHHSIADGIAAIDLARRLLGDDDAAAAPPVSRRPPDEKPRPIRAGRGFLGGVRRTVRMIHADSVPKTVLVGRRSVSHGVAFVHTDLSALQKAARESGATVNDALLAAMACGLRAALVSAGEPVPAELPVSVPVALPRRGAAANQVGVMLVRVPLGSMSPAERLERIAGQTRRELTQARTQGTLELMRGPLAAGLLDRLARHQHLVAGFLTNVVGPTEALRLAGAPVEAVWPVGVIAGNVRVGVAAVSYAGGVFCSVHFDAAAVSGSTIASAMQRELAVLARASS